MNATSPPLEGTVLGISISESDDLEALGFSELHLQDALTELARFLLSAGATLTYGGDLRAGGFTFTLFDLLRTYKGSGTGKDRRIRNYLAWPIHLKVTKSQRAELKTVADIVSLPAPEIPGLDPNVFLPPIDAEKTYAWCLSLTRMRERLARDNSAQILMGGRLVGYKGKYPGLVEEAYETMKAEKPLFLIGAYGGCTRSVIDAIQGERPPGLTEEAQFENGDYQKTYEYFNGNAPETEERIDYGRLVEFFNEKGVTGLHNGLSPEENQRLFTTPHVPEIVSLILQGLISLKS